jgi:hypothetical protein
MNTYADKTPENKSKSVTNTVSQKQSSGKSIFQFVDNRPESIAQRKLQEMANNSPQVKQAAQLQSMLNNYSAQQQPIIQKKENNTGLPDNLKSGMENLSGMSLDDVKVHYNSVKPAQLQAHAYAQGTDIHLAPGQEKHLPHEAWHVVQQKQGRVKLTMQMKGTVNVNDDVSLEKEADVMGAKAMTLQLFEKQQTTDQATSTSKTLTGLPDVLQMRWINIEGTNQSYWEGRGEPIESDLAELASQNRVQAAYQHESIPYTSNANRPHGLFLASSEADQGEVGAPLPLPQPSADEYMPQSERDTDVSWFHDGTRVQHSEDRRSERTIHGGVSARDRLQQYGLPDYERAAWAHTQPDHATSTDQDRERTANRHPSTEQANQQHTVREFAQMNVASRMGGVVASRHLQGELPDRQGLFSSMDFGTSFITGENTRTHTDSVPYFTQQPGRYGDEDEHAQMLNTFGANALASGLRDDGVLDSDDLPDEFYINPDGMEIDSNNEGSQSSSSQDQYMGYGPITGQTPSSQRGGGGGAPVIAQAAPNTLTLAQMDAHYNVGNVWAAGQGTFSPEFALYRANPANAFNVLVQAGLLQADAHAYALDLNNALEAVRLQYMQVDQAMPGYLPEDIQNMIFDHIGAVHGRSLWALLRYLNAANHQGNGN